ncbi:Uncharacterised protein [Yersinia pseudotuberculosis]|nr:Uncharacterised protein [Yersinia pseudotuberculosis]
MRKHSSTADLFRVRVRQLGNPVVTEGFSYTAEGVVTLDAGNNRRTRRMVESLMRKGRNHVE